MLMEERQYGVVIALLLLLIAVSIVKQSESRELRPSEHGLAYQDMKSATDNSSSEMLSFFGGTDSGMPLPEAKNMSDPSWWSDGGSSSGVRRRAGNELRVALLVTGLVCGTAGVALLLVAAFVFMFRFHNQRKSLPPPALPPPPSDQK